MNAFDLQPTLENIREMFLKDSLERNKEILRFCTILDSIDGRYSIALDGKWGCGKTFFVKQVKMLLDAYNNFICSPVEERDASKIIKLVKLYNFEKSKDFELQPQVAVYYDAWANDNDEDPILSLIYAIIQSGDTDFELGKKYEFLKIAGSIGDFFSGKRVSSFLEAIKGYDVLQPIRREKSIHELMSDFFDTLLKEHGNRLVLLIDELDRCKPSYAVKLLERIKHYFDDDRVTFVFSINTEQLQHTIRRYYGNDFSASRYLDKFFDLRITLPPPNMDKYYASLSFNDTRHIYDKICRLVIDHLRLELREISKFIRITKIAAYKVTHNKGYDFPFSDGKALQYALTYILPIMIGLKITEENAYTAFVSGKYCTPLLEVFERDTSDYFRVSMLLGNNETYDNKAVEKGNVLVSAKEKINDVYQALFVQDYKGRVRERHVGSLEFNDDIKNKIMQTVSLLSEFADYDNL